MISITTFIPGSKIIPGIIGNSLPGMIIHVSKGIEDMSTQERINVINIKAALILSIERPGSKVASQSLVLTWWMGWTRCSWSCRGGRLGWSICEAVTNIVWKVVYPVTLVDSWIKTSSSWTIVFFNVPGSLNKGKLAKVCFVS